MRKIEDSKWQAVTEVALTAPALSAGRQDMVKTDEPVKIRGMRESIKVQAAIGMIGAKMGFNIWVPRADRGLVRREWGAAARPIVDSLPLSYDDATVRTVEQIDVLWLKGQSIVRAFEVEHSTLIYSGILRMADLLALQPYMNIQLHVVAPYSRRDKVFEELLRPVFYFGADAQLPRRCTYLSYDSIKEIAAQKHLHHLSPSVLDDYAERADRFA
jgi:hypothetical protein